MVFDEAMKKVQAERAAADAVSSFAARYGYYGPSHLRIPAKPYDHVVGKVVVFEPRGALRQFIDQARPLLTFPHQARIVPFEGDDYLCSMENGYADGSWLEKRRWRSAWRKDFRVVACQAIHNTETYSSTWGVVLQDGRFAHHRPRDGDLDESELKGMALAVARLSPRS